MSTPTNFLIQLSGIAETFTIDLAGTTYTLTIYWNDMMAESDDGDTGWTMDIGDATGVSLACGLPMITGADLLDGLEYLGINGSLIMYTNGMTYVVPTFDNLGTDCNLYFQTTAADNGN